MSVASYPQLKSRVAEWLARSDLTNYIPTFIQLFEGHANRIIRHRKMEVTSSLSPVSGICALPSDFLEQKMMIEVSGVRRELSQITQQASVSLYPDLSGGAARNYTIIGDDLHTFPRSGSAIELTYFRKIPTLSDAMQSNWLLEEAPLAYLHGSLAMAGDFIKDDSQFGKSAQIMDQEIDRLNAQSDLVSYKYSRITLRGPTP